MLEGALILEGLLQGEMKGWEKEQTEAREDNFNDSVDGNTSEHEQCNGRYKHSEEDSDSDHY